MESWYELDGTIGARPNAGTGNNERFDIDTAFDGTDWRFRVVGNEGTGTYILTLTDTSHAIFTSPDRIAIPENTTATVVAEAVDDGETVSAYRIVFDRDHRHFKITSPEGTLKFKIPPDYEQLKDDDLDNVYVVVVEATSGPDGLQSHQRIEVTITDTDDIDHCAADTDTTCSVEANGEPTTGSIITSLDADWFSVTLESGTIHRIDVRGSSATPAEHGGTLDDPYLAVYDEAGDLILNASDDNSGEDNNARLHYTQTVSGTYYVEVSHQDGTGVGTYTVSVTPTQPPAKPTGLSATSASHNVVELSWNDPDDTTITGYQVLRRDTDLHDSGRFLVHVNDTGSPANTYIDRDVSPETAYVYRIKARIPLGPSSESGFDTVSAAKTPANIDTTPAGAKDLGDITDLATPRLPSFSINGNDDVVDYYRFTLTELRTVEIGLRQQDKNADLHLENPFGEALNSSENHGTANERISARLLAGTYYPGSRHRNRAPAGTGCATAYR